MYSYLSTWKQAAAVGATKTGFDGRQETGVDPTAPKVGLQVLIAAPARKGRAEEACRGLSMIWARSGARNLWKAAAPELHNTRKCLVLVESSA